MVRMHKMTESTERAFNKIAPSQIRNFAQGLAYGLYGAASILAARRAAGSTSNGSPFKGKSGPVERIVSDAMDMGNAVGSLWRSVRGTRWGKRGRVDLINQAEVVLDSLVETGQTLSHFLEDVRQGAVEFRRRRHVTARPSVRFALWVGGLAAVAGGGYGAYQALERYQNRREPVTERMSNRLRSWFGVSVAFLTAGLVGSLAYFV